MLSLGSDAVAESAALQVASQLQQFDTIYSVGLIIFGLHLVGLGYLSVRSGFVPRLLGWLLYFGGASYTLLHAAHQISALNPEIISMVEAGLSVPMALSEILLAIWLIYRGLKKEKAAS